MKLSDYLSQSGLSMQAFADEIGLSYEGVRLIVKGQRMPAPKTVFRIEKVTDGAVSRSDLRPDLWPGPKAGEAA